MSLHFADDTNDRVDFGSPAALDNLNQGTVLMWCRFIDVNNVIRAIFSKVATGQPGIYCYRRGADGTTFRLTVSRITTNQDLYTNTGTLVANEWAFIACVWDITGGNPKLYKGNLTTLAVDVTGSTTVGSGTKSDDSPYNWAAGLYSTTTSTHFDVAYFAVYSTNLSIDQIRRIQFRPVPINSNCGISSWLGFNGTGTQADWSGNGNNGTVSGAVQSDNVPLPPLGFDLLSVYSGLISGSTCWGHVSGVTESNIRTFASNWSGTGAIENSGDTERLALETGEYMNGEVVQTGARHIILTKNVYDSGDNAKIRYRTGTTEANCLAASWNDYTVPFLSDGYVQVRMEATI